MIIQFCKDEDPEEYRKRAIAAMKEDVEKQGIKFVRGTNTNILMSKEALEDIRNWANREEPE